jgi:hypothetical protein
LGLRLFLLLENFCDGTAARLRITITRPGTASGAMMEKETLE